MYLGVMIDSESYANLICVARETLNEVKCEIESIAFDWDFGEVTWEDDFLLLKNANKVARGVTNGDEYWLVAEIFKVNENKIYLVQWHAYDGVDFDLIEFDAWDNAYNEMKCRYYNMIEEFGINTNINQCDIDTYKSCIDDDNEWHMMQIVMKGE